MTKWGQQDPDCRGGPPPSPGARSTADYLPDPTAGQLTYEQGVFQPATATLVPSVTLTNRFACGPAGISVEGYHSFLPPTEAKWRPDSAYPCKAMVQTMVKQTHRFVSKPGILKPGFQNLSVCPKTHGDHLRVLTPGRVCCLAESFGFEIDQIFPPPLSQHSRVLAPGWST